MSGDKNNGKENGKNAQNDWIGKDSGASRSGHDPPQRKIPQAGNGEGEQAREWRGTMAMSGMDRVKVGVWVVVIMALIGPHIK